MVDNKRYSIKVGSIDQQEIDLLECLMRIDMQQALDARANDLCERLIEAGLVDSSKEQLTLTLAGIERCQSLKHRIAGDKEAAKVLADRGLALTSSSETCAA